MDKKKKISLIIGIIIWVIIAAFLAVIIFRRYIFPDSTIFYNLFEDIESFENPNTKVLVRLVKSLVVILGVLFVSKILRLVLGLFKGKNKRILTMISLLQSVIKYGGVIILVLFVLSIWGVNTATLVASAGVLTLIIGLGCQTLVADIVSGLFILFEGDFQVGDVVVIDGWRGTVINIGLRTTKIEDALGNIKIINNSNISDIVNNSKQLSFAVCLCDVDYDESIEKVESVIEANLGYIKKRIPAICDGPYYKGVETLGASAVTIKLMAKCKEDDKFQVQRDMNREIKIIFDKNNISIPFSQIVVSERQKIDSTFEGSMDDFVDEQKELSKEFNE